MLKSVTFEVTGNQKIVCEGCEERVETLLKGVQGVNKVRAHSRNQRVDVLLNTAVLAPAAIVERLNKAGFEAKIATAA
jgi:copper chaperone